VLKGNENNSILSLFYGFYLIRIISVKNKNKLAQDLCRTRGRTGGQTERNKAKMSGKEERTLWPGGGGLY
jgi:hypothetical protein